MKEYQPSDIRNIAVIGHGGCGKTSLAEALLHAAKAVGRRGSVDQGTSILDSDPDEIERRMTISTGLAYVEHAGCKINLLDTPGYLDFVGEVVGALRVADSVLVVLDATGGVAVGTQRVWDEARKSGLPALFVVNKPDKDHAEFEALLEAAAKSFGPGVVAISLPIGLAGNFRGIVDILGNEAVFRDGSKGPVPAEMADEVAEYRSKLMESVAETDEGLLELYLEEGTLPDDRLREGLRIATVRGEIFPLLVTCADDETGALKLLDAAASFLPNPTERGPVKALKGQEEMLLDPDPAGPLALFVFKKLYERHLGEVLLFRVYSGELEAGTEVTNAVTGSSERINQIQAVRGKEREDVQKAVVGDMGGLVKLKGTDTGHTLCGKRHTLVLPKIDFPEPVIASAIKAKSKGDEDKISSGLARLMEEDPTLRVVIDPELKQTVIWGMGELHIDLMVKRLKSRFGVQVDQSRPKIPYRETIKGKAEVQGKYKKQTGGRGQYGDVWLRVEPLPRSSGFEFVDAIVGGVVPGKYIPAVEKGIREAMNAGVLAGYPVVDARVSLFDGSYHDVDSSDMAFKIAASMGFKKAMEQCRPVLLEPIYMVDVVVPEEFLGDVMGDLSSRRGKIQGVESRAGYQTVRAAVPMAELDRYSTQLRSLTQGRAMHSRSFSHYEEVPGEISERVIADAKAALEE
ncbi:elongation factor G [Candidatus Fermentibacteria bacterium]|nr:elongation factor G [Candidatus Fermentibacteria bacterium]